MKIYSIHDQQGSFFLPPFYAKTSGIAQRMFIMSLGDSWPHRADFALYELGQFDEETGAILTGDAPVRVLSGLSIPEEHDPRVNPAAPLRTEASVPNNAI